ncbi:MAG: HAD family phosphatase [Williamsia sp.]|nr:HAD family phosphatase [Williamsia sp.]
MYKAVFTDMDGTLLRKDHSISEATRELVRKIVDAGIPFILVSARPMHGILPISQWLGTDHMPIVSLNGAYIGLENKIIFRSAIDLSTVTEIHAVANRYDVTLIYYCGMEWFAEKSNAATLKEQRITEVPVRIAPYEGLLKQWEKDPAGINKIMAIGKKEVIGELEAELHRIYGDQMNVYTSKPTYLEIMRRDASKTNAVKFLMERYGIQREEVIAIGDNFNDKEMIDFAGTGIAMGNAPDEVKAVADWVTDTNQHDGVRKAFEKYIQLSEP